jgi:predicted Zn-dependent peptidase
MKYDGILLIQMALENKSVNKSISYVKKCLSEMQNSKFSDEDLQDAINNIIVSLDLSQDNNNSIMNNYVFKIYDNLPDIEERKELLRNITREEIVAVSKKIKLNNIYVLEGKVNE